MATNVPPKKNTACVFYTGLVSQADTRLLKAAPTLAAGDFKVSIDGGAFANLATLPTVTPAAGTAIKISLSSGEMNGDNIVVTCIDAAGAEWCDQLIELETAARHVDDLAYPASTGQSLAVDASGRVDLGKWLGVAPASLTATGKYLQTALLRWLTDDVTGTPKALMQGHVQAAPACLTSGDVTAGSVSQFTIAVPGGVNNQYKDCWAWIIDGTGLSQLRLITAYNASTGVATVAPNFVTAPDVLCHYAILGFGEPNISQIEGVDATDQLAAAVVAGNTTFGAATAANQATILARLGSWTGTGLNTILGALRAIAAKAAALTPTDLSTGTTFDNTTDSTEAIRDRGDAAWATGSAAPTAIQNADALLDRADAVEVGLTPRQAMRLGAAADAGKLSGAAGPTVVIRNAVADSKDRVTATVDNDGNRTAVVTDVT